MIKSHAILLKRLDKATKTFYFIWLFNEPLNILEKAILKYDNVPFQYYPEFAQLDKSILIPERNKWFTL